MKRTLSLIGLLFALSPACARTDSSSPMEHGEDSAAGTPFIVAHRGASADAPENTIAAFRLAFEQGADAIEGDFWMTADCHIVAHHDQTPERTAGIDREVELMTLAELQVLDVGGWGDWAGSEFVGERIPMLEEVIAIIPSDRQFFIELKSDERIVPALAEILTASTLKPERYTIISFDSETLAAVRNRLPDARTCWLTGFDRDHDDDPWSPTIVEVIETARRISATGVDLNANLDVLTKESIARIREAGLDLHTWTVNDTSDAQRLIRLGVDSITTDHPGRLRRIVDPDDG